MQCYGLDRGYSFQVKNINGNKEFSEAQVMSSLKRMAEFVVRQNIGSPNYMPIAAHYISDAGN